MPILQLKTESYALDYQVCFPEFRRLEIKDRRIKDLTRNPALLAVRLYLLSYMNPINSYYLWKLSGLLNFFTRTGGDGRAVLVLPHVDAWMESDGVYAGISWFPAGSSRQGLFFFRIPCVSRRGLQRRLPPALSTPARPLQPSLLRRPPDPLLQVRRGIPPSPLQQVLRPAIEIPIFLHRP